jgi:hypothetical protein
MLNPAMNRRSLSWKNRHTVAARGADRSHRGRACAVVVLHLRGHRARPSDRVLPGARSC